MSKKKLRRIAVKTQKAYHASSRIKIYIFITALIAIGIIGKSLTLQENYKVLGITTFLATSGSGSGGDGSEGSNFSSGSSDSSDSDSPDDSSGSSNSESGTSSSVNSGGGSSGSSSSSSGSNSTDVLDSTRVMCVGPDGKQFETKRRDCEELNRAWNKPANFTVLPNRPKSQPVKTETRTRSGISTINNPSITGTSEQENESDDSGIRIKTESKTDEERTEVRLSETERIRTRTKDGRTRIDITSGGIKTRFEIRDDRVVVKAEQEDGTEVELEDDTLFKIDDRLGKDNIKVATAGAEKFLVQKGKTGAVTKFPVSVDLASNTVFVNTSTGEKKLTVLPEKAIEMLIAANVVNRLGSQAVVDAAVSNNLDSVSQLITLGERNGIPVYEINGISNQKLLGFIPVQIEKEVIVSAETGNALSINESLGVSVLDAISF